MLPNPSLVRALKINAYEYKRKVLVIIISFEKFPLSFLPCLSVMMSITEIKKEPIEHENPIKNEETALNETNNPPINKVSFLVLKLWFTSVQVKYCKI